MSKFFITAHELFAEIKSEWKKSTKVQKASVIIFAISVVFILHPSEFVTRFGYGFQVIFWLLFMYIIASKSSHADEE